MNDHDDHSRDSSDPPPPLSQTGNGVGHATDRVGHAVDKSRRALASAADAASDAAVARADVKDIKELLGNSPDLLLGVPGRGLLGGFAVMVGDVRKIGTKVDELAAASEGRKSFASRVIAMIAGPSVALAVAAVAAWLAGFHR